MQSTGFLVALISTYVLCCASQRMGPPCPKDWELGPCSCSGHPGTASLTCGPNINATLLDKILKSNTDKVIFRDISLEHTELEELHANLFLPHAFYLFFLSNNSIVRVQKGAFNGSEETAQVIRLDRNKISSFSKEALSELKNLQVLQLNRNKLTTLEDSAFPHLPSLKFLDLSFNEISTIGKGSFAKLSELERLDLSGNEINRLEGRALTIDNNQQSIQIVLANNNISYVDEAAFSGLKAPLIDLTNNSLSILNEKVFGQLCKDGAEIIVENNPFDCDAAEMFWLKKLSFTTKQRISGFHCTDGITLDELKLNLTLPESIFDRK